MPRKTKSRSYKLSVVYTIFYSLAYLELARWISQFLLNNKGEPMMPMTLGGIQMMLVFWPLLIFTVASAVSFPLIQIFYSMEVNKDYLGGMSSPYPLFASRRSAYWEKIARISYRQLFLLKFYVFYDSKDRVLCWVPLGISNFDEFKEELKSLRPGNAFSRFLDREERYYFLNLFPMVENKFQEFHIMGYLKYQSKGVEKPLAHRQVEIYLDDILMGSDTSNDRGEFRYSFSYFPGNYTIKLRDKYYQGEMNISLPQKKIKMHTIQCREVKR